MSSSTYLSILLLHKINYYIKKSINTSSKHVHIQQIRAEVYIKYINVVKN